MKNKPKNNIIQGVGINDANYRTQIFLCENGRRDLVWVCPYYRKWCDMLKRCYSRKRNEAQPTYKGCTVCQEWLVFSNFKKWMETKNWEGRQLDKDILQPGNKEYCPANCVFVYQIVNTFILSRENARGEYPLGVYFHKKNNKFVSLCSNPFTGKQEHLGCFDNPEDAHIAWKNHKHELACQLADSEYVDDERVAQALRTRYL